MGVLLKKVSEDRPLFTCKPAILMNMLAGKFVGNFVETKGAIEGY